ncbi:MAG: hypothetical protein PVF17_09500 [Ignavibacteria bacterium]
MKGALLKIGLIIALSFYSCSNYDVFDKSFFLVAPIIILTELSITEAEEDIACYCSRYNKFPEDSKELFNLLDTCKTTTNLFSKFELEDAGEHSAKYNFEMKQFTAPFKSYSENSAPDSVKITKSTGSLFFSDSLISNVSDTIVFVFNFSDIEGTIYEKNDSLVLNKYDVLIKSYLDEDHVHKIAGSDICSELSK